MKEKIFYKIKCIFCGKEVFVNRKNQKTCNNNCRIELNRKKALEKSKLKSKINYKEEKKNCIFCGKEFIWRSYKPTHKFCSKKCSSNYHKEEYKKCQQGIIFGKNNKLFNFYRLRFEVFKRDNFTCQYCGRNVKDDKIKLHTDHIIPENEGGKTIFSNLVTSCKECNLGKSDILLSKHFP
jgi:5-methylcytosine-specific restriction endonuclease McrA